MKTVENLIAVTFHRRSSTKTSEGIQSISSSHKVAVRTAETQLIVARNSMREVLRHVFDQVDMHQRAEGKKPHLPKEIYDCSLAAIALLQVCPYTRRERHFRDALKCAGLSQMAQEMCRALRLAERVAERYEESPTRLWYPRISLQWLGVPPGQFISDDHNDLAYAPDSGASEGGVELGPATDGRLTASEAKEGLAESGAFAFTLVKGRPLPAGGYAASKFKLYAATNAGKMELRRAAARVWSWDFWRGCVGMLWTSERMLRARVSLSRAHRAVQHSNHWKHGLKNAIGVAVLTFPAFMPENSFGGWFRSQGRVRRADFERRTQGGRGSRTGRASG